MTKELTKEGLRNTLDTLLRRQSLASGNRKSLYNRPFTAAALWYSLFKGKTDPKNIDQLRNYLSHAEEKGYISGMDINGSHALKRTHRGYRIKDEQMDEVKRIISSE